jgi:hypothetical protein
MKKLLLALLLAFLIGGPAAAQSPQDWQYQNITTEATTTLKSTPGVLHTITFNNPVATGTVTIYDNTAASGTKIGTITVPSSPMPVTLTYDVAFWTGLTIVTGAENMDITVSFR